MSHCHVRSGFPQLRAASGKELINIGVDCGFRTLDHSVSRHVDAIAFTATLPRGHGRSNRAQR